MGFTFQLTGRLGPAFDKFDGGKEYSKPAYEEATPEEAQAMIDAGEEGPFVTVKDTPDTMKTHGVGLDLDIAAHFGYKFGANDDHRIVLGGRLSPRIAVGGKNDSVLEAGNAPVSAEDICDAEGCVENPEKPKPTSQDTLMVQTRRSGIALALEGGYRNKYFSLLGDVEIAVYAGSKNAGLSVAIPRTGQGNVSPDGSDKFPLNGISRLKGVYVSSLGLTLELPISNYINGSEVGEDHELGAFIHLSRSMYASGAVYNDDVAVKETLDAKRKDGGMRNGLVIFGVEGKIPELDL